MVVHFHYPIFWTACNLSARPPKVGSKYSITKDKAKVTCGNCKRTGAFFSRDNVPGAPALVSTIISRGST